MSTNLPPSNTNSSVGSGSSASSDPYNRYAMNTSGGPGQSFPRQPYGLNTNPTSSQPNAQTPPANYSPQSEYYRNDGQVTIIYVHLISYA